MKNLFKIASVVAVATLLVTGAFAQKKPAAKKSTHKAAAVMCPVCNMPLAMKKSKDDPVAVRLKKGGKVMYCCSACKMPASVLVKSSKKAHHAAAKKPAKKS